jgi:hypothetical protein
MCVCPDPGIQHWPPRRGPDGRASAGSTATTATGSPGAPVAETTRPRSEQAGRTRPSTPSRSAPPPIRRIQRTAARVRTTRPHRDSDGTGAQTEPSPRVVAEGDRRRPRQRRAPAVGSLVPSHQTGRMLLAGRHKRGRAAPSEAGVVSERAGKAAGSGSRRPGAGARRARRRMRGSRSGEHNRRSA